MGLIDWFSGKDTKTTTIPVDDFSTRVRSIEEEQISKSNSKKKGNAKAYEEPVLGNMSMNPDYKEAPSVTGSYNLFHMLKYWSRRNIILNAIINTRVNQVSLFCSPSRFSDRGVGYEVRLKDPQATPSSHDMKNFRRIEEFLQNTGKDKDLTRDTFTTFVKKLVRDRLTYDKINFEMVYDSSDSLHRFKAVDASTIYVSVDKEGKEPKDTEGEFYVQMIDEEKVAEFTPKEMAWEVHNPRTDIYAGRYGYPELEVALPHLRYHENTETFNERYFSQGGTTRGLLHIKAGQEQSQNALSAFRREWTNMFSGINGAWKIPVITAEDVKFVSMNQSSKDMEKHRIFHRKLSYSRNSPYRAIGIE